MKTFRILAAACLCLIASNAMASKCYVKEFSDVGAARGGLVTQVPQEPAIVDQTAVDFTAGHAESAAFNAATTYIRVWCDAQASYLIGSAPVATNAMSPLTASIPEYLGVRTGHKISFVANP